MVGAHCWQPAARPEAQLASGTVPSLPAALCRHALSAVPCASLQDKILQSMGRGQEVTVTNDGATILKAIYIDNPAAKVLVGTDRPTHNTHQHTIALSDPSH